MNNEVIREYKKKTLIKINTMKMYQNQDLLMFLLEQCNLVNNNYQQASKVLFTFVANKQFGQLINISPHSLIMLIKKNT